MRLRLPLHGRSHRKNGSDPIPDAIFFNVDNQGGYLDITANDQDADGQGILLDDESGGTLKLFSLDEIQAVATNNLLLQSGVGATLAVVKPLFIIASGGTTEATINVGVTPGNYFIIRNVTGGVVEYLRVGDFGTDVKLLSGGKFRVLNASFSPIFEVDEDGTVHIKTGGTIVADL